MKCPYKDYDHPVRPMGDAGCHGCNNVRHYCPESGVPFPFREVAQSRGAYKSAKARNARKAKEQGGG